MEFARPFYMDELLRKRGNGFIKIVTGLRRCGKSYLLRKMFRERLEKDGVAHIVEVGFDERENRGLRNPDIFWEFAASNLSRHPGCVFLLDEIQMLDDFESVLNGLLSKRAEIYATGSNAKFLSKDVITEFRGRGNEIHMRPLSFSEYYGTLGGDKTARFGEYMVYGGLPMVANAAPVEDKIEILNSLYSETYIRDIVGRNRIRKPGELEDLINILSSNIGTLVNPEKLCNIFKTVKKTSISANTVAKYLNCLEDAYLVERARRYDVKGNAYIDSPFKAYCGDLGLRNARLNFRQIEETHAMENIIYNELRARKFNVDVGAVAVSEKNRNGSYCRKMLEVDFVANKGPRRYYIQSAYMMPDAEKRRQETRPLLKVGDSFKKIVVTAYAPGVQFDENGIQTMNVCDFLLNPASLDF